MKCAVICLTTWSLLIPTLAAAQPSDPPAESNAGKPADRARMAEDIEVMRRILLHALLGRPGTTSAPTPFVLAFADVQVPATPRYRVTRVWDAASGKQATSFAGSPHLPPDSHPDTHGLEGTYLKGYGVVYSMTLPLHYRDAVRQPGKSAGKPVSEWERVRRELHGGKVEAEDHAREAKDASLADAVIQALAENGRHFGELPENEQVTVAITLRSIGSCQACHAATAGQVATLWTPTVPASSLGIAGVQQGVGEVGPTTGPHASQKQALARELEAGSVQVSNLIQLGDLRMKEDRPREAAEVYEKALEQHLGLLEKLQAGGVGSSPAGRGELEAYYQKLGLSGASLASHLVGRGDLDAYYLKLARAYLRLGESEKALDMLKKIDGKPARKEAADGAPLPAKLVISAPKRLLDQVGNGKMTFEEFRKQVAVEYRSPTPAEKKPSGSTSSPGEGQTDPNKPQDH